MTKVKNRTSSDEGKPTSARLLYRPESPDDGKLPAKEAFAAAAAELDDANVKAGSTAAEDNPLQPQQAQLLAAPEEAVRPSAVQNGRLLATYVGLGLERNKDQKLVHLDFSFPLEDAHDGYIPKKVKAALEWLKEQDNKAVQITGLPAVTLDVYDSPASKKATLHLIGAEFTRAIISVIEEVGKGKAKLVWRFSFRLRVERDEKVIGFAAWRDEEEFLDYDPTFAALARGEVRCDRKIFSA